MPPSRNVYSQHLSVKCKHAFSLNELFLENESENRKLFATHVAVFNQGNGRSQMTEQTGK